MIMALLVVACLCTLGGWLFALGILGPQPHLSARRRFVTILAAVAVTASVGIYAYFFHLVTSIPTYQERLEHLLPLVRAGFWLSVVSLVSSIFAAGRSRQLFLTSSIIIWVLWTAAAMGT